MLRRILCLTLATAAASAPLPAHAASLVPYLIATLGLTDAAHTGSDGYQRSTASFLNESGLAAGISERFDGLASLGTSAWIYDSASATTTRIGFFDAAHTGSDGSQASDVDFLNQAGLAVGISDRFGALGNLGYSAWVYDSASATTARIGFFDAAHTGGDGSQSSFANLLNETGLVVGGSERFASGSYTGQSAWLYDSTSGATSRVGFFDAAHTGSDGAQFSSANLLNESGLVAGQSDRYTGGSYTGQTAWLYDSASATTVRVGFVDAEHTGSGGVQLSSANLLNESGLVAGQSDRYTGESYMGQSAWLYDNTSATTTRVGLVDAEHTGSDGVRFSYANLLSQSGLVVGQSDRYLDEQYLGQSAWVYDSASATTARVGLVDAGTPEAAGSSTATPTSRASLASWLGNPRVTRGRATTGNPRGSTTAKARSPRGSASSTQTTPRAMATSSVTSTS